MQRTLLGLTITVLMAVTLAAADVNVRLIQGGGYPVCVAIVAALRRMPPSIPINAWPESLPPIPGVTQPRWTSLDPTQHLDEIRAFMIQRERQSIIQREQFTPDDRTDDAIWSEIGPSVKADIRSGQLKIEETTIRSVKLGEPYVPLPEREWTTDIRFVRIGHIEPVHGTVGSLFRYEPGRTYTSWAFAAAWFSQFPDVHNDLVEDGQGERNLILVAGQPWFADGPGVLGIPYTNDLDEQHPTLGEHRLFVYQRCFIGWPPPFAPPKGEKPRPSPHTR